MKPLFLAFASAAAFAPAPRRVRCAGPRMECVSPPAKVLTCGGGPIQSLVTRLAALDGYAVTYASTPEGIEGAKKLVYDAKHPEGCEMMR